DLEDADAVAGVDRRRHLGEQLPVEEGELLPRRRGAVPHEHPRVEGQEGRGERQQHRRAPPGRHGSRCHRAAPYMPRGRYSPDMRERITLEPIRRARKVLLHDHLHGGLRPSTVIELAAEAGHHLPTDDPVELQSWFTEGANRRDLDLYL